MIPVRISRSGANFPNPDGALTNADIREFTSEFRSFIAELRLIKQDLCNIKDSVQENCKKTEETHGKVILIEPSIKRIDSVEAEMERLKIKVESLERSTNDVQQYMRMRNIEIKNLPKTPNEDLRAVVKKIAEMANFELCDRDVEYVIRISSRVIPSGCQPSVILCLATNQLRDNFLTNLRVKKLWNSLTTADIGMPGDPTRLFFTEHLTVQNRMLYFQVRSLAKQLQFRYCWVRSGRVYVRKSYSSPVIRIDTAADLNLLE